MDYRPEMHFEKDYWFNHPRYKNIQAMNDWEIIKELYERLRESDTILQKIKGLVTSSYGTADVTDFNQRILEPLYFIFDKNKEKQD